MNVIEPFERLEFKINPKDLIAFEKTDNVIFISLIN